MDVDVEVEEYVHAYAFISAQVCKLNRNEFF